MEERHWRIFRENHDIILRNGAAHATNPIRGWLDLEPVLPKEILSNIKKAGFKKPTPIQMQGIPLGLQMRDLLALAPTGSGKSCAFLLPMISFLLRMPRLTAELAENGPYGLIMAPTRELAQQIDFEFQKLTRDTPLRSIVVVGGKSVQEQGA
jgi:ATP-dependent RNA helicase DDX23/PRP28